MRCCDAVKWIERSKLRSRIVAPFNQPMTARQMAQRLNLDCDACSNVFGELRRVGLLRCLNESARRSRIYWLTDLAIAAQRRLCKIHGAKPLQHSVPAIDWDLFGWLCFSHRAAVLKAFSGMPMQPSGIKKRARFMDSSLRMNANNVRDVVRLFLAKGLLVPVKVKGKKHLWYELSAAGLPLRGLLLDTAPASWNSAREIP